MKHFVEKLDHDRRLSLRHSVSTDLRVRMRKFDAPEQRARSENLSQRGVFFTTDLPLSKGSSLYLLVEMPEQVTGRSVRAVALHGSRGARCAGGAGGAARSRRAIRLL